MQQTESRRGFWFGVAAYGMWGLFPLYWPLLKPSGAGEILANRMLWSLITIVVILAAQRLWRRDAKRLEQGRGRETGGRIRPLLRQPRRLVLLATAAAVISVNWGVYIWGVNNGHVVETSLGYFVNPLVTVLMGVFILGERLRRWQWAALGVAALAVVVLTLDYGRPPWIAWRCARRSASTTSRAVCFSFNWGRTLSRRGSARLSAAPMISDDAANAPHPRAAVIGSCECRRSTRCRSSQPAAH